MTESNESRNNKKQINKYKPKNCRFDFDTMTLKALRCVTTDLYIVDC